MFDSSDARSGEDPRDSYEADPRDRDADDGRSLLGDADPRERNDRSERKLERDHGWDARARDPDDPRDVLLEDLRLPRGREREVVWDHDETYELNGEYSRTLAAVGAFRVVSEGRPARRRARSPRRQPGPPPRRGFVGDDAARRTRPRSRPHRPRPRAAGDAPSRPRRRAW